MIFDVPDRVDFDLIEWYIKVEQLEKQNEETMATKDNEYYEV